jgi:diguanylate cyclase (GGDEF)-like protein
MLIYANVTERVKHASKLEQMATRDGMTGLNNKRAFLTLAETEWSRFRRYDRPLSLLVLDIDHFKSVNDTYGHDVGDRVIVQVADACRNKRESDIAARIGGEEFAVLLPETTLEKASAVAERLRNSIAERNLTADGRAIRVTISVGVAEAGEHTRDITDLIKQADLALYEAKRTGRNRVCCAGTKNGATHAAKSASAA